MTAASLESLPPKTRRLIEAPVLPTLLRLAAPNVGEAMARVTFITMDAYFVSWLGSDALAGVAVVFPIFIVLQTISAAGVGAGVNSAIARALGAGRGDDARRLVGTAVGLALALGIGLSVVMLLAGPLLYRAMGLGEGALKQAANYGGIAFGGSVFVWLMNTLANCVRGQGNMIVPASAIIAGELVHLAISPAAILGLGPFPQMGVAGAAVAVIASYATGTLVLAVYLLSRKALVPLVPAEIRIRPIETGAIMRVGLFAALVAVQFQLTTVFVTMLAGRIGGHAIAAYGVASRLEILQLPTTFALGSAIVTMVGTAIGAGFADRAARVAWAGAMLGAMLGSIFLIVALTGEHWMRLFTTDPVIVATGRHYLACQALAFPLFGAGLCLYYALQGTGEIRQPFLIGMLRLVLSAVGGWAALEATGDSATALFVTVAIATALYGIGVAAIAWRRFGS